MNYYRVLSEWTRDTGATAHTPYYFSINKITKKCVFINEYQRKAHRDSNGYTFEYNVLTVKRLKILENNAFEYKDQLIFIDNLNEYEINELPDKP